MFEPCLPSERTKRPKKSVAKERESSGATFCSLICSQYDKPQINAEINDEPKFEHSSLTQTIGNALTRSCGFKNEPVFPSLKKSFGEQVKAVSH